MGTRIESPEDESLQELCQRLRELATGLDRPGAWPSEQLRLCGEYGVFEWFLSTESGGQSWTQADVMRGYLELSAACLTTTFVITQRTGACRRIEACDNEVLKARLLPDLASGKSFATVGISHLTTSRRHLAKPVLRAEETVDGFVIDGFSPWVTGGPFADHVLIGATLDDGRQILAMLPMDAPGVSVPPAAELVGLSASHTENLRTRSNSLALRSSQAALAAAKGTGYVVGHPAGRWCREALFFLVWSCPQPVMAANLCELAGLAD